jgi:alanyl-tRNA synthetase
MIAAEIRDSFVEYYRREGFSLLPRAPMLHPSIPMSFVMSAGLVQVETSLADAENRDTDKYVLVQECFRHFDLDRVGMSDTHLSLFEMPGAFVFGPDGRESTVQRMWTLATSILGIDREQIWISYFAGGEVFGEYLPPDEETYQAWIGIDVPKNRLVGLGPKHNYWTQGGGIDGQESPRKAGPNTELFYDRGENLACGPDCGPGCRCGRFIEFSNSLFICRQKKDNHNGSLHPMEEPFAETVIGTERVAMILQNAGSVFDIASNRPIMETIAAFVRNPNISEPLITESKHVIADYLKALYILIADGAPPPGKNGRERIIKLLIRGVVTRQILLNINAQSFLSSVFDSITQTIHNDTQASSKVKNKTVRYFSNESERFKDTIERGHRQLERFLSKNGGHTLSGSQIVSLEKERGLPHLITAMMLQDKGLRFNRTEYREALEAWKKRPHS